MLLCGRARTQTIYGTEHADRAHDGLYMRHDTTCRCCHASCTAVAAGLAGHKDHTYGHTSTKQHNTELTTDAPVLTPTQRASHGDGFSTSRGTRTGTLFQEGGWRLCFARSATGKKGQTQQQAQPLSLKVHAACFTDDGTKRLVTSSPSASQP